ncbi:MAG: rhodanese-like domain-containing protein [bacterium]|nr:rhodanese-like domain-containing protein [bacterium]MDT8395475.1 rhodanese-like domain-containing protein [bacterium]
MRIAPALTVFFLFLIQLPVLPGGGAPPGPGYTIDADQLADILGSKDLVILDARGPKAHRKGHIPGAIPVSWQGFAVTVGRPGSSKWGVAFAPQELSGKFGELGVDAATSVVVYGDPLGGRGEDGRFVWMLLMLGVEKARILNGGFPFWQGNGYPVSREKVDPVPVTFGDVIPVDGFTVDSKWVHQRLGSARIVDSRTAMEFNGSRKRGEARGGHIPGAVLIPYLSLFREDGRLKTLGELKALFETAGLEEDDEIAAYCTAGIRSSFMVLALRMAGYGKAANYDQSFFRWAADKSLPVE